MKTKRNILLGAALAVLTGTPLHAQNHYIVDGRVVTVFPINPPRPSDPVRPPQHTALDHLEAAFFSGTISPAVAAQRVCRIPEAGGFAWIKQNGYDPSAMGAGKFRDALAPTIAAIESDRRLHSLINAINAAIDEQNEANKQLTPTPVTQSNEIAPSLPAATASKSEVQKAQQEAMRLYPELAEAGSALNEKFLAAVKQARKSDPALFERADWPLHIAKQVANDQKLKGKEKTWDELMKEMDDMFKKP